MPADCRIYLITPPLALADVERFPAVFDSVARAANAASALARLAPGAEGDAKRILSPLVEVAQRADVALLIENDTRLAARINADGAQIAGVGTPLQDALASLHPDRIVGVAGLRLRDEAMEAGEAGADYVMLGEPRKDGWVPPFEQTLERVDWWAQIIETPCVAYAGSLDEAVQLAAAGADFVALGDVLWAAPDPVALAAEAKARIAAAAGARP